MREGGMRNLKRFFTAIIVGLFFVSLAAADTLELKSGRVVQGKYLGGTQHILRFEVNGEVQTFSTNDIVALTFTGRSSSPAPAAVDAPAAAPTPGPAAAPAPAPAPAPAKGGVTLSPRPAAPFRHISGGVSSIKHVCQ